MSRPPRQSVPIDRAMVRRAVDAVRYAKTVTTAADGTFSISLPAGLFAAAPVVSVIGLAASRDHVATLSLVSTTSIQGRVRKSRPLPASITAFSDLQSYDVFESPGVMTIHVTATEAA